MKFPVAGGDPKFRTPPVMVPMAVFWTKSKSSKSTAPGTELVVPGLKVTEMAFAGLTASTHPAATSTALGFDFMAVTPLDEPPQPPLASALQHMRQLLFLGQTWAFLDHVSVSVKMRCRDVTAT